MSALPTIISTDTQRPNRVPPGQKLTDRWPVLHYGPVHCFDLEKWKLSISGLVEQERALSFAEFAALPQVKVFSDIHCVTTWSRLNNWWQGISSTEVHRVAHVRSEARFVIIHAAGGFTTNLTLADFLEADVLFAMQHDDQPLSPEHGAPVRLIVPRLYFWKSAKWVTGIEYAAQDQPGFWEANGYHNHGDPWKEERYSR